jgi:hypothetical protein
MEISVRQRPRLDTNVLIVAVTVSKTPRLHVLLKPLHACLLCERKARGVPFESRISMFLRFHLGQCDGESRQRRAPSESSSRQSDSSSNSPTSRCRGRKIPSLFILESNVVRFSPSLAAAPCGPPIIPLASRNVCKIRAASQSRNVPREAIGRIVCGRGFGSTPLSDWMTARSVRFWSSRTLPGLVVFVVSQILRSN